MNDFIKEIEITNRVDWCDWEIITKNPGPMFLEFLRNKVIVHDDADAKNENGDPAFWGVINWIEENANDLWYVDGSDIYFYALEDAIAFKLRWI